MKGSLMLVLVAAAAAAGGAAAAEALDRGAWAWVQGDSQAAVGRPAGEADLVLQAEGGSRPSCASRVSASPPSCSDGDAEGPRLPP